MAKWQASKGDVSPRKGYIPEIELDENTRENKMRYTVKLELLESYEIIVEAPDADTASDIANDIDLSGWKNVGSDTQHFEVVELTEGDN